MSNEDLVRYFMDQTNKRLDVMDQKLDRILQFKWTLIGASTVISIIASTLIAIIYQGG